MVRGTIAFAHGKLPFNLAIDRIGQPFAIARHGRSGPSMPECSQTDGIKSPKRKALDPNDPSVIIEDDNHLQSPKQGPVLMGHGSRLAPRTGSDASGSGLFVSDR